MKRIFSLALIAIAITSCAPKTESYKFLDAEHKTFYVNGVSAMDGYNAVIKSLEDIGFVMGDVTECDLSYVNQGVTYYTALNSTRPLTEQEFNILTNGLFIELPSGFPLLETVNDEGCRVFLRWYKNGIVNEASIQSYRGEHESDAIEINKRLATMFPYSKVSNSRMGYLTYYNDYGVEVYYTNDYEINMKKK